MIVVQRNGSRIEVDGVGNVTISGGKIVIAGATPAAIHEGRRRSDDLFRRGIGAFLRLLRKLT